ncbi:MAG: 2-phosphosulfolactate phosphatase [Desulfobacterales bacterium]|nr:2-phosphosulfolactate phosphatase [Desulfobacterales bacterium]
MMKPIIEIRHQSRGATQARGIVVVIDVLRAFSTVCYIAAAGARRIWAVADGASALALFLSHGPAVLIGERHGRRLPGFDWGNSPSLLQAAALANQAVIFTTSNGTRGVVAARYADEILTGGFVNAGAVAAYIRDRKASHVSLVCMGSDGRPALEDTLCALYLKATLEGKALAFEALRRAILRGSGAAIFKKSDCADMPPEDLKLCLDLDRFDFVLRAVQGPEGVVALERVPA